MADDGSGNFTLPSAPFAPNTTAQAGPVNDNFDDIATALTGRVTRNGSGSMSGALNMGTNRINALANGALRTDAATVAQVQDGAAQYGSAGGTADAITLTVTPAITAYAAGQTFRFISTAANTGAATLNVSSLGAKNIRKETGATALASGDIPATAMVEVTYDGTQFILMGVSRTAAQARAAIGAANIAGDTFTGAVGFGSSDNILYSTAGVNVWQWEAGATDQIWYDPADGLHVRLDNVQRFWVDLAGTAHIYVLDVGSTADIDGACTIGGALTVEGASATVNGGTVTHSALSAGALGGFMLGKVSSGSWDLAFGDTIAGSNLSPSDAGGINIGSTRSGTWRCLGEALATEITLFQRIA